MNTRCAEPMMDGTGADAVAVTCAATVAAARNETTEETMPNRMALDMNPPKDSTGWWLPLSYNSFCIQKVLDSARKCCGETLGLESRPPTPPDVSEGGADYRSLSANVRLIDPFGNAGCGRCQASRRIEASNSRVPARTGDQPIGSI